MRIWLLLVCAVMWGQDPELGRVERFGARARLTVDGPRPVDMAAKTLAAEFGMLVNAEDPGPGRAFVRGRLVVEFPLGSKGILQAVVDEANAVLLVRYRLDGVSFVGEGSILDRRVTIPMGKRTVAASAELMAQDLARQTGARVHCCQGFVAGIPWGMREVAFGAEAETARTVLQRLIDAEGGRMQWLVRCDASKPAWCFINLIHVPQGGDILP